MRKLVVYLIIYVHLQISSSVPQCIIRSDPIKVIEPDADIFLTVIAPIHHRDNRGLYSCGDISRDGVTIFEAIKWTLMVINQNGGLIEGQKISERFVPGIKIGAKVIDTCGHQELAIEHLIKVFPLLSSPSSQCLPLTNESEMTNLVVFDAIELSSQPKVMEAAMSAFIPIIPLSPSAAVTPSTLTKMIARILHDLEWTRIAIVHASNEEALFVVKSIGQLALSGTICVSSIEELPMVSHDDGPRRYVELRGFSRTFQSLVKDLEENIPILVVGDGEPISRFVRVMSDNVKSIERHQWLFTSQPPPEVMSEMEPFLYGRVFTLSPYPQSITHLEQFWHKLSPNDKDDDWFNELVEKDLRCSNCSEQLITWRTRQSLPIIHTTFVMAHALRKSWLSQCNAIPGMCPQLRRLSRQSFISNYLEPLEFIHNMSSRSPHELFGIRKTVESRSGEIENLRLSLTRIVMNSRLIPEVLVTNNGDAAKIIDANFNFISSPCPSGGCNNCLKVRQSRIEESAPTASISMHAPQRPDGVFRISGDIQIGLLVPIHKRGNSPLECSSVINPMAIYDMESAIWMIQRINEASNFVRGVKIGLTIVDTCSSPLVAAQRVGNLLLAEDGSIDTEAISFVSSIAPEDSKQVLQMLKALNTSVVSAVDITSIGMPMGQKHSLFQTAVSADDIIIAAVEQIKYFGWKYVSIVADNDDRGSRMVELLRKHTKTSGICLATVEMIEPHSDLTLHMINLKRLKESGAKVVIMMTKIDTTISILQIYQKMIQLQKSGPSLELLFFFLRDAQIDLVHSFEEQIIGSLLLKESFGSVSSFYNNFVKLSQNVQRNPWFKQFTDQCGDNLKCVIHANVMFESSNINTMQSLLSIVSALTRLRNDLCPSESGVCRKLQASTTKGQTLRGLMSHYIETTASVKADKLPLQTSLWSSAPIATDEMFHFTTDGTSSRSLEVLNFRRDVQSKFNLLYRFDKVAHFADKTFIKNPSLSYTFYDSHGHQVIPTEEVRSHCINFNDCKCPAKVPEFLYFESNDNLIVIGALNVHLQSKNPLQCGPIAMSLGVQNVEAFMWALDVINSHPQVLPGVQLGALLFDTCFSSQKAMRDVSNFLSSTLITADDRSKLPSPDDVIGFIIEGDNSKIIDSIVEVSSPMDITTVAPHARNSKYNNHETYSQMIRLSSPNDIYADGILSLLMRFSWHFVSVLYDTSPQMDDVFRELKIKCNFLGVEFAMEESIRTDGVYLNQMISVIQRLKKKAKHGAKVVILLLQSGQIRKVLEAAKKLHDDDQLSSAEFLWVTIDAKEVFHDFPEQSFGAITLQQHVQPLPAFKNYFMSLNLRNNSRNPWFQEYWESKYDCRGAACYNPNRSGQSSSVTVDRDTTLTINSLFAIANGLELVRQSLCRNQSRGMCPEMTSHPKLSRIVYEMIKKTPFSGADGKQIVIDSEGGYAHNSLTIANFRHVTKSSSGITSLAWTSIGRFSPQDGLIINLTKARGYTPTGDDISLIDLKSVCIDQQSCAMNTVTPNTVQPSMTIPGSGGFVIGAIMPVHGRGSAKDLLSCGPLNDELFQNAVAFAYALEMVNLNRSILGDIQLGAIVLDDCGRQERAQERLLNFLSSSDLLHGENKVPPKSLVAMITYSDASGHEVNDILAVHKIAHLIAPVVSSFTPSYAIRSSPYKSHEISAIIDLISDYQWKLINVIYSDEDERNSFIIKADEKRICIDALIAISDDMSLFDAKNQLKKLNDKSDSRIIVILGRNNIYGTVLESVFPNVIKNFVWIGGQSWMNFLVNSSQPKPINAFAIKTESYSDDRFVSYLSSLSLSHYGLIPLTWMHQFWQRHFKCQIAHSPQIDMRWTKLCTGEERLSAEDIYLSDYVHHTIHIVQSIANGLQNYLSNHCLPPNQIADIDECGDDARDQLNKYITESVMKQKTADKTSEQIFPFGFHIQRRINGGEFVNVGLWKNGHLRIAKKSDDFVTFRASCSNGNCNERCERQFEKHSDSSQELLLSGDSLPSSVIIIHLRRTWGVITAVLSALGVVSVLICAFYFLMVFPVAIGTTVLGYQILLGLLMSYAINFAYLLPATFTTCWIRRFAMSLAWTLVISGMLVKVMNTWRLMAVRNNNQQNLRMTSPYALLMISSGLVSLEFVVTLIWLFLFPPHPGLHDGTWKCSVSSLVIFDSEIIVSLLYITLLLVITMFFAVLTWKCYDQNREPRWIMVCCLSLSVIWFIWFIVDGKSSREHTMSIVCCNLVASTLIMAALYGRKLYIFTKMSRQSRLEQKIKSRLQPHSADAFGHHHHQLYGALKSGAVNSIVWDGAQRQGTLRGATRAPFEADFDDNISSCGSVKSSASAQVQGHDLYPMDVYDGGSQFAPMSSLFSQSNKSVYGITDDTSFR